MVYCGIPSKACAECRTRRTKCDYLKPSCSQCIRKDRKCSGYRDPVAALFRDEAKRQHLTGPKKCASNASRKTGQEIDKALAACSTMFVGSSLSDLGHGCGTSLLELKDESLQGSPPTEYRDTFAPDPSFTLDEPDTFPGGFGFIPSNERWGTAGHVEDSIIPSYLASGLSNNCFNDSTAVDPRVLIVLEVAKQLSSTNFSLDEKFENENPTILSNVSLSMEAQAPCYFFANYVLESTIDSNGFLDYLPGLCENEVSNSFLIEAVKALGLVGLAMKTHDSSVFISARKSYASALNQLNVALTSKGGSLTDQALTTVFLLGLYETNTCSTPQNLRAWTKHIKGALAMFQLRGKDQLASPVGRQIFAQWRNQIVTFCLHRREAIPEFIVEWSQDLLRDENEDERTSIRLCLITTKLCALRADMKYFRNYSKSGKIVPWALAIDAELSEWADICPYRYTTVKQTQASDFVYENYYHVYGNLNVATLWNEHRRMRMLCHELLLQHLPHLIEHRGEYPNMSLSIEAMKCQLYDSKEIIERLAKDICASVPFHFGLHLETTDERSGSLAPKAVCGNMLLRPLYMAGEPRFVSNSVRKWVIGRFENIAEVMGIKLAHSLAHLVRIGIDPDEWENTQDS